MLPTTTWTLSAPTLQTTCAKKCSALKTHFPDLGVWVTCFNSPSWISSKVKVELGRGVGGGGNPKAGLTNLIYLLLLSSLSLCVNIPISTTTFGTDMVERRKPKIKLRSKDLCLAGPKLFFKLINLFLCYKCFAFEYMCAPCTCSTEEARRGCWSYIKLWAAT